VPPRPLLAALVALGLALAGCGGSGGDGDAGKRTFRVERVVAAPDGETIVAGLARVRGDDEHCGDSPGYVDDFTVVRVGRDGRVGRVSSLSHERLHDCAGEITSALLQPDGALLLSGWVLHPGESGGSQGPIVTRFLPGGGLDEDFGEDGVVGTGEPAVELALAPDGTILTAAGSRLSREGSRDAGFRAPVPGSVYGHAIAPLPGGFAVAVVRGQEDLVLAGFDQDGRPDPSFGSITSFAPRGSTDYRELLDLVADARHRTLLVLGDFVPTGAEYRYFVYRFGIDGRLDRRFGSGGRVLVDPGAGRHSVTGRVALQADGKVVAFGAVGVGARNELFVARYTARGRRDRSFGRRGVVLLDLARASEHLDYRADGAVLPGGQLVVAGSAGFRSTVLYRLRTDGSLDRTFSRDGRLPLRTV
jgi:uncharacterized delta-60 repeat protein